MGSDVLAVDAANQATAQARWDEVKQYAQEQDELTQARVEGTAWSVRVVEASTRAGESTLFSIGQWNKVVNMRDENAEAARLGISEAPNPSVESDWQFYAGMEQNIQEHAQKQNEMFSDVYSWEPNADDDGQSSLPGSLQVQTGIEEE